VATSIPGLLVAFSAELAEFREGCRSNRPLKAAKKELPRLANNHEAFLPRFLRHALADLLSFAA
jgi:hypothetical protein